MSSSPFKWRHYQSELILLNVRWYLRYALSYRDLEEMMAERGLDIDHSTIARWVSRYAPELDDRCRSHLRATNDSWRVDETYIKVKGVWKYLYRAVDSAGNTLDFLLTARRDGKAAKRFLRKVLQREHVQTPRVITTDKNGCYVKAIRELKESGELPDGCEHRQVKYLNNIVEQDHRFTRHRVKASQHFREFWSAQRTLRGYETMNAIRKGQMKGVPRSDIAAQVKFVNDIFRIAV
ncbi:MAG: IS6 family transposase [Cyanobacteria bacterium J06639_1]